MKALFSKSDFHIVAESQVKALREKISQFTEQYLNSMSEAALVEALVEQYQLDPPTIGEPYIEGSQEIKVDVRGDPFRPVRDLSNPFYVQGVRIEVRIPYQGDSKFFDIVPTSTSWNPPRVEEVREDCLVLGFKSLDLTSESIRQSVQTTTSDIQKHLETLKHDCEDFNSGLTSSVNQGIEATSNHYILNILRLPARLDVEQAAALLGFQDYEIPLLVKLNQLKPLGNPAPNSHKWFASAELVGLAADRAWLDRATKSLAAHHQKRHSSRLAGFGMSDDLPVKVPVLDQSEC